MGYIVRVFLGLLALSQIYQGVFYVMGPKNRAIKRLFEEKNLEAPILNILVPFLGITYLNLGIFNLLAGIALSTNDACYVIILSGLIFHLGSAIFRSLMSKSVVELYKKGKYRRTNIIQYVLGPIYVILGVITRCLEFI